MASKLILEPSNYKVSQETNMTKQEERKLLFIFSYEKTIAQTKEEKKCKMLLH